MSVLPSLPGSSVTRDKSNTFPLISKLDEVYTYNKVISVNVAAISVLPLWCSAVGICATYGITVGVQSHSLHVF